MPLQDVGPDFQPGGKKVGTTWRKKVEVQADLVTASFENTDGLKRSKFFQVRFAYLWLLKGNGRAAIFLSYCLFWAEKSSVREYGSFYKSFGDIQDELNFPKRGVMHAVQEIKRLLPGVLETELVPQRGKEHLVTAYTVHYEVLLAILKEAVNDVRPDVLSPASEDFEELIQGMGKNKGNGAG